MTNTIYERPAETAKKIRKVLKEQFPGVKFSVRSSSYSMGSSIDVRWTDGPMEEEVAPVVDRFSSASFDGYNDSEKLHGYEWEGKHYSGAKYIFAQRTLSPELRARLTAIAEARYGDWERWDHLKRPRLMEVEKLLKAEA